MACSKLEARGHLLHKTGTTPKHFSRECTQLIVNILPTNLKKFKEKIQKSKRYYATSKCRRYHVFKKEIKHFLALKTWKNCPQMLLIIGPHFFLSVLPTGPKPAQITFSVPLKMSHCKTSILWLWFKFLHSVDEYSIRNPVLVMELSVLNEISRAPPSILVMYNDGFLSPQYGFLSVPSMIVKLSLLKSKYFMLVHSGSNGCGISSFIWRKIKIPCTRVHGFEEKTKYHVLGYMDLKKKQNSMYRETWNIDFFHYSFV
jgi:hypothetical protein